MADIYTMNKPCIEAMKPDLLVFLDVPTEVTKARRDANRADKEIYDGDDKQARIRRNYLDAIEFLKEQGENVVVVDASRGIDEVSDDIKAQVFAALNIGK